ncbi:MAG: thioredoxin family protein [Rhizobiales bacterium]|nr:thioredoxin family protein [Hyphomicrobiales bacterium]MBI3671862.1 thioredoxin family protein [Hyphomicrobiales bacterium]
MTALPILLLTRENCGYCDLAKQMLDRLSGEFPLAVSTLSLDTPRGQQLAEDNGILFPPGLFIDGKAFSYGRPSERKLRRAIEGRLSPRQP